MRIQFRYRSMVLAALAISLLAIAGFPQTAWAGNANANNARSEVAQEKKASNNGQSKKADDSTTVWPEANNVDGAGGPTTHGSENGPGGQTCDGDPDNEPGAGGVYENTCDEYDSPNNQGADNGAGDGKATGKPCEGCVGNADDKNPGGQAGGGPVDHNNGYECDQRGRSDKEGNNGIGFGNPAHTGCTAEPECVPSEANNQCQPPCVPTPQNQNCGSDCVPSNTNNQCCPAGSTMVNGSCKTCPAGQTMNNGTCECPAGSTMVGNSCKTCPAGQNMNNGTCECPAGTTMVGNTCKSCPAGENMDTAGNCSKPCVAGTDAECTQVTPTCVASSGNERCGGVAAAAVLGEQLGRLDVLGVSIEQPAAVAPAALARTGGFALTGMVQAGIVLALFGLGMTVIGRRRRTVDIASRIGD